MTTCTAIRAPTSRSASERVTSSAYASGMAATNAAAYGSWNSASGRRVSPALMRATPSAVFGTPVSTCTFNLNGPGSARQQGADLLAEGGHLVDQLVHAAAREPHLQMVDADSGPAAQVVGDLLG